MVPKVHDARAGIGEEVALEFYQIRYFVAVARTLNFSRAAEQCNVSQPALTRAVQKLEYELGAQLIHRDRHYSRLTDFGQHMLPLLERSLADTAAIRDVAKVFKAKKSPRLRLGLAPSICVSLFAGQLAELSKRIPDIRIGLTEENGEQMAEALLQGQVDVAVSHRCESVQDRLDCQTLFEERYVVIVARNHPLARFKEVPISAIRETVWLEHHASDVKDQFEQICFGRCTELKIRHGGLRESHLQHLAAAGLGALLAPEHTARLATLVARPIEGNPLVRKVQLLTAVERRRSPAVDAFVQIVRHHDWRSRFGGTAAPSHTDITRGIGNNDRTLDRMSYAALGNWSDSGRAETRAAP